MQEENIKNQTGRNNKSQTTIEIESVFESWNKLKQEIDKRKIFKNYCNQEIWWCSMGKNVGSEEDGKNNNFERPVLILKRWNSEFFIGLPFTTKKNIQENSSKYYYEFNLNNIEKGYIMLSQIRTFSSKRLIRKIKKLSDNEFMNVNNKLREILFD